MKQTKITLHFIAIAYNFLCKALYAFPFLFFYFSAIALQSINDTVIMRGTWNGPL